jgi:multiple sugar transport system permease protein
VPVLVVVVVFVFLTTWNDLLGPLIYLNDSNKYTVSVGLSILGQQARLGGIWNLLMAANLIAIVPAIILFYALQKRLIGGIASVGIKG